jgi:hypothetical protein
VPTAYSSQPPRQYDAAPSDLRRPVGHDRSIRAGIFRSPDCFAFSGGHPFMFRDAMLKLLIGGNAALREAHRGLRVVNGPKLVGVYFQLALDKAMPHSN